MFWYVLFQVVIEILRTGSYNPLSILIHPAILCLKLSAPKNGRVIYSDNSSSSLGLMDTAVYSCDPGFGLFGGDTVRTCIKADSSSGEWTGTAPTCQFKGVWH